MARADGERLRVWRLLGVSIYGKEESVCVCNKKKIHFSFDCVMTDKSDVLFIF